MELDEELDEIHFDEEKALRVRNSPLLGRLDLSFCDHGFISVID